MVKTYLHTVLTSSEKLICLITTAAILLFDKDVARCQSNLFKFPLQIFPNYYPNINLNLLYCRWLPLSSLEASLWSWSLLKISAAFAVLQNCASKLVNPLHASTPWHNSSLVLVVPRFGSKTTCEGRHELYSATQNCGCHI